MFIELCHLKLYIRFIQAAHCQGAQAWNTQLYLHTEYTIPAFYLCKRSLDGATTDCSGRRLIVAYCPLIVPERTKGWVGVVGWSIADGFPT